MSWSLTFDGSEVQASEALPEGSLRLRLSAASVHRAHGPSMKDGETGFLKPVDLLFLQAHWTGDLPLCMGALSEGVLRMAQGTSRARVALPGSVAGPLHAEFTFRSGAVLAIQAASFEAACPDEAHFMPSYAC